MPPKFSRRLVIDASVARASGGEDATFPTSKHCRDFLTAALEICHCVVMTKDIKEEWDKHQSNFARRWRVSMVARKKLYPADVSPNVNLRSKIEGFTSTDKEREALLKDCLLIEAALATDKAIISLDETVRKLFSSASQHVTELRSIVWVNPDRTEEQSIDWLEKGAKLETKRKLNFSS